MKGSDTSSYLKTGTAKAISRSRLFLTITLTTMMTHVEAYEILQHIKYLPGWSLYWRWLDDKHSFMYWVFTDEEGLQECRKWLIDLSTATKSDLVQTALRAALDAAEHEVREKFKYRGRKLYGPHFDPDKLAEFSRWKENLSLKDNIDYPDWEMTTAGEIVDVRT